MTYGERVNEYLNIIKTEKRNIGLKDEYVFSDETYMFDWYSLNRQKYMKEEKTKDKNSLSEERTKERKEFKKILDYLRILKTYKTYKRRVEEYIKQINKLKRNISKNDNFTFNDGISMYKWYSTEKYKYNKCLNENMDIDNNNYNSNYNRVTLFPKIIEKLDDIENEKFYEKAKILFDFVKENKEYPPKSEFICFDDGTKIRNWYDKEIKKIKVEVENNIIPNERRLNQIMTLALIDDYLFNEDKSDYECKIEEYFEKVKILNRHLNNIDTCYYYFNDRKSMNYWYRCEERKLYKERKEEIIPNESRMNEIMLLAKIDNYLYDNKNK